MAASSLARRLAILSIAALLSIPLTTPGSGQGLTLATTPHSPEHFGSLWAPRVLDETWFQDYLDQDGYPPEILLEGYHDASPEEEAALLAGLDEALRGRSPAYRAWQDGLPVSVREEYVAQNLSLLGSLIFHKVEMRQAFEDMTGEPAQAPEVVPSPSPLNDTLAPLHGLLASPPNATPPAEEPAPALQLMEVLDLKEHVDNMTRLLANTTGPLIEDIPYTLDDLPPFAAPDVRRVGLERPPMEGDGAALEGLQPSAPDISWVLDQAPRRGARDGGPLEIEVTPEVPAVPSPPEPGEPVRPPTAPAPPAVPTVPRPALGPFVSADPLITFAAPDPEPGVLHEGELLEAFDTVPVRTEVHRIEPLAQLPPLPPLPPVLPPGVLSSGTYYLCGDDGSGLVCASNVPVDTTERLDLDGDGIADVEGELRLVATLLGTTQVGYEFEIRSLTPGLAAHVFASAQIVSTTKRFSIGMDGTEAGLASNEQVDVLISDPFSDTATQFDLEIDVSFSSPRAKHAVTWSLDDLKNANCVSCDPFVHMGEDLITGWLWMEENMASWEADVTLGETGGRSFTTIQTNTPVVSTARLAMRADDDASRTRLLLEAEAVDLPTSTTLKVSNDAGETSIEYAASTGMSRLEATGALVPDWAVSGQFLAFDASVTSVPDALSLVLDRAASDLVIAFDASLAVDDVRVQMASYVPAFGATPEWASTIEVEDVPPVLDILVRSDPSDVRITALASLELTRLELWGQTAGPALDLWLKALQVGTEVEIVFQDDLRSIQVLPDVDRVQARLATPGKTPVTYGTDHMTFVQDATGIAASVDVAGFSGVSFDTTSDEAFRLETQRTVANRFQALARTLDEEYYLDVDKAPLETVIEVAPDHADYEATSTIDRVQATAKWGTRQLSITIEDLPDEIHATFDLDAVGGIQYRASLPVSVFEATYHDPFLDAWTRIDDIPTQWELAWDVEALDHAFDAIAPVGRLQVTASTGAALPAARSMDHLIVRDDGVARSARVDIRGLTSFLLDLGPGEAGHEHVVRPGGTPILLALDRPDEDLQILISAVPEELKVGFAGDPASGSVRYDASGSTDLTVHYREHNEPVEVYMHVDDVPASWTAAWGRSPSLLRFDGSDAVRELVASISTGGTRISAVPMSDHAMARTTAGGFAAHVQISSLQRIDASMGDTARLVTRLAPGGQPFYLHIERPGESVEAAIDALPDTLDLEGTFTATTGTIDHDASSALTLEVLYQEQNTPVLAYLGAVSIPRSWDASWDTSNGAFSYTGSSATSKIEIYLQSQASTVTTVPAGDHLVLVQGPSGLAAHLLVHGLVAVDAVASSNGHFDHELAPGGQPFTTWVRRPGERLDVHVDALPAHMRLEHGIEGGAGSLAYDADATLDMVVYYERPSSSTMTYIVLDDVPEQWDADWDQADRRVAYDGSDPITRLTLWLETNGATIGSVPWQDHLVGRIGPGFGVHADIGGLESFSADIEETGGTYAYGLSPGGQAFATIVEAPDAFLLADTPALPATVEMDIHATAGGGDITYIASSTADLRIYQAQPSTGHFAYVDLVAIPTSWSTSWNTALRQVLFEANAGVGRMTVWTQRGRSIQGVPQGDHVMALQDAEGEALHADVHGLKRLLVRLDEQGGDLELGLSPGGQQFTALAMLADAQVVAHVPRLPASVDIEARIGPTSGMIDHQASAALDIYAMATRPSNGAEARLFLLTAPEHARIDYLVLAERQVVTYEASSRLGYAYLLARESSGGMVVQGQVLDMAPYARFDADAAAQTITADARTSRYAAPGSASVSSVLLRYGSHGALLASYFPEDYAIWLDSGGRQYAALRLTGFEYLHVAYRADRTLVEAEHASPRRVDAYVYDGDLYAVATIMDVPAHVRLEATHRDIRHDASSSIAYASVMVYDLRGGWYVMGTLIDVPSNIQAAFDLERKQIVWSASDTTTVARTYLHVPGPGSAGRTWDAYLYAWLVPADLEIRYRQDDLGLVHTSQDIGYLDGYVTNHGSVRRYSGYHATGLYDERSGDIQASLRLRDIGESWVQRDGEDLVVSADVGSYSSFYTWFNLEKRDHRLFVQGWILDLPDRFEYRQDATSYRMDAASSFGADLYFEVGDPSSVVAAPGVPYTYGFAIADGSTCGDCYGVRGRLLLFGLPTFLSFDSTGPTLEMRGFTTYTYPYFTADIDIDDVSGKDLDLYYYQGVPGPVTDITISRMDFVKGVGSAPTTVDMEYTSNRVLGTAYLDGSYNDLDVFLYATSIPSTMDVDIDMGKTSGTYHVANSHTISMLSTYLRNRGAAQWQAWASLTDVPRVATLEHGVDEVYVPAGSESGSCGSHETRPRAATQTVPYLRYTATDSRLDASIRTLLPLHGGSSMAGADPYLYIRDLGKDTSLELDGTRSRVVMESTPATKELYIGLKGEAEGSSRGEKVWKIWCWQKAFIVFKWDMDEYAVSSGDIWMYLQDVERADLQYKKGIFITAKGDFGRFGFGMNDMELTLDLDARADLRIEWPWGAKSDLMLAFVHHPWYHYRDPDFVFHPYKSVPYTFFNWDTRVGARCPYWDTWRIHATGSPTPLQPRWNGVMFGDSAYAGNGYLVTPINPDNKIPWFIVDATTTVASPYGADGYKVRMYCD